MICRSSFRVRQTVAGTCVSSSSDRYGAICLSVIHVPDQNLNVSLDLCCVNIIVDLNLQTEGVAKFCFVFELTHAEMKSGNMN